MVVFADETRDLLLWLSHGDAEESKQEKRARDHRGSGDAAAGGQGGAAARGGPHG